MLPMDFAELVAVDAGGLVTEMVGSKGIVVAVDVTVVLLIDAAPEMAGVVALVIGPSPRWCHRTGVCGRNPREIVDVTEVDAGNL